jgi:hypothetical protein
MLFSKPLLNFGMARMKYAARTASEMRQIATEKRIVASMPRMFKPRKMR